MVVRCPTLRRQGLSQAASRHRGIGLAALLGLALSSCKDEAAAEGESASLRQSLECPDAPLSPAPLRRLTRFEYENALSDVFGGVPNLGELLPRDEVALGFDNQAGTLSLTDLHVVAYAKVGDELAAALATDPERLAALGGCTEEALGTDEGEASAGARRGCAAALLGALGQRLWRRALADGEIAEFLGLFEDDFSAAGFREGISRGASALLQSAEFLYRFERTAGEASSAAAPPALSLASPWVLASRLGFLLWGSVPDEALLASASKGQLASAADVEREARRLLADPRARRGVAHFYLQWLDLADFGELEKDQQILPLWSLELRTQMARETARFIDEVLWEEDARFETLLRAPYTFTNAVLADLYGLPIRNPDSEELVRTSWPEGARRLGILTQAAIVSAQSKADQTSPIHRGKFIREQFFCTIPEPPPPSIIVAPPRLDPRKTTRERFEQHRSNQFCATCHEQLDPVGLVFEHFDAVGRYRETEADQSIDASGYLVGTDVDGPLDGVESLVDRLNDSGQVRRCMVTQWFRYAMGRPETEQDTCSLDKLEQTFEASGGDLRELLVALTQTDAFLRPTPAPELVP